MISTIERRNAKPRHSQLEKSLAAACGVLLILCGAQAGLAQAVVARQSALLNPASPLGAATPVATDAAPKPAAPKSGTVPDNGTIKVHGHWVLNVTNADGTIADRREFENSLVVGQGGDAFLIGLLAGYYVPGDFAIQITGTACGTTYCSIVKSASTQPGISACGSAPLQYCSTSLVYNVVLAPASGSTSIALSGFSAPPQAGTITDVFTVFNACGSTNGYTFGQPIVAPAGPSPNPPSHCVATTNTALDGFLTHTNSFLPLQITGPAQSIKVSVTLTFS